MKRLVVLCLAAALLSLLLPLLASCDTAETVTLYVYNWGEYISDGTEGSLDVNAAFCEWYEREYGVRVKVNYSTYSSNEDMYAKISSGAANYDVVIPSDYMIARMISESEDRVPITDWYYTDDARQASFQARSVLGGFYKAAWTAIKAVWDNVVNYFKTLWDNVKLIFWKL